MFVGQREQPARKAVQPGRIGAGQGQRQREAERACTHRGQVGQVHRQAFVAEREGVRTGDEVAALDQHVGRYRQLHAGTWRQQGAVVADAEDGAALAAAHEVLLDEIEFGEHPRL
jgi:hypothetical protein